MNMAQIWMERELIALEKFAHSCHWDEVATLLMTARALVSSELSEDQDAGTKLRPNDDERSFQTKIDDLIRHATENGWSGVRSHLLDARRAWESLNLDRQKNRNKRLN